jgi:hypothetical protein
MSSIGIDFAGPAAAPETAAGKDLLAHPSPWRRLALGALVVAGALPTLGPVPVLGWAAAWFSVCALEQRVARPLGYVAADLPGSLVTGGLAALCALAAAALIRWGDPGARLFAVSLLGVSCVNIVLRFYASPRTLIAAMAPHALVLGWVGWGLAARDLKAGETLRIATPLATSGSSCCSCGRPGTSSSRPGAAWTRRAAWRRRGGRWPRRRAARSRRSWPP